MLTAKVRGYFPSKRGFVMLPESSFSLFLWSRIPGLSPLLDVYQILWEGRLVVHHSQQAASWVSGKTGKGQEGKREVGKGQGGGGLGRGCLSFGDLALEITSGFH